MFGFVNSDDDKPKLGGEVIREKRRKSKIIFAVLGVIAFIILNLVLYYLTKI